MTRKRKIAQVLVGLLLMAVLVLAPMACKAPETPPVTPPAEVAPPEEVVPPTEQKVLKIGCIQPYTGPYGFYGNAMEPAQQAYVDLLNEDGGVKIGKDYYKIEMHFYDDKADPTLGPIAAQKLIDDGCVADVGCYSLTSPIGEVLTPAKVIFVGQMMQGFDLNYHKYFIGGLDGIWQDVYVTYGCLEMWPDVDTIGFISYDWQVVQSEEIIKQMTKPGSPIVEKGIPVYTHFQPMGDMDFMAGLTKFHENGVNLVLTIIGPGDFALLTKQANELGFDFHYYTYGTLVNLGEFIALAGRDNAQGLAFDWPVPWEIRNQLIEPDLLEMAHRIEARYSTEMGTPSSETYKGHWNWGTNQIRVLLGFYEEAGTTDPDRFMEVARGGTISDFTGTWTLGGAEYWGAPVVKPTPCLTGVIQGDIVVWGNEYPWLDWDWIP